MLANHYWMNLIRSIVSVVVIVMSIGTVFPTHAQNEWEEVALLGRGSINQMMLSPDGKILATGGSLGIWLYDVETLEPIKLLQTHHSEVMSFAFSSDSTRIAALGGYSDNVIRMWDIETETELLNIAAGEERYFRRLALSLDGELLATTATDGAVQIWDVETGNEIVAITGFEWLQEITFSADSSLLIFGEFNGGITSDPEGYLHVWDIANQQELTTLESPVINKMLYSPDGAMLAATSEDYITNYLIFWDSETWQPMPQTGPFPSYGPLLPLAFSQDGQWLATASYNPQGSNLGSESTLILAKSQNLDESFYLGTHPTHIVDVVFSQDGKTLFSASEEGILKVWDVETQTELAGLDQPVIGTLSAAFAPDGQTFAIASDYRIVQVWDTSTATIVKTLQGDTIGYGEFRPQQSSAMFSPDGSLLVSSEGYNVFLWEVETGNLRGSFGHGWGWTTTPTGFDMGEQSLAVTNSISMGNPAVVRTLSLDLMTMQPIVGLSADYEIEYGTDQLNMIAISNNGRFEASSGNGGMTSEGVMVDVIDVVAYSSQYQGQVVIAMLPLSGGDAQYIEFSADSNIFAAVDAANTIHLWMTDDFLQLETPENVHEIATLQGHTAPVTSLIFSTNGTRIASVDNGGTTRIWDLSSGDEIVHLTQRGWIFFSPSWEMIAINDDKNTVHLWDLNTQSEIANFSGKQYGHIAFSPDGQTFIYEDAENILHLWDINTQTEIALIDGHVGSIRDLVFSPDSQTLLTVGNDSSIRIWRRGE